MAEHRDTTLESLLRSTLTAEAHSLPVAVTPADVLRRRDMLRRQRVSGRLRLLLVAALLILPLGALAIGALRLDRPQDIPTSEQAAPGYLELQPGRWYADWGLPFRLELHIPPLPDRPERWPRRTFWMGRTSLDGEPPGVYLSQAEGDLGLSVTAIAEVDGAPCDPERDPVRTVSSARDLVDWLRGTNRLAAEPIAVTVRSTDGRSTYPGWQLGGITPSCTGPSGEFALGPWLRLWRDETTTVTAVDIEGSVVAILHSAGSFSGPAELGALARLVDSIRIGPTRDDSPPPALVNPWPGHTVSPDYTPRNREAQVRERALEKIRRNALEHGVLVPARILRVTLVPANNVYLTYDLNGEPAGTLNFPGPGPTWVVEAEGTHTFQKYRGLSQSDTYLCRVGIVAFNDEPWYEPPLEVSCLDPDPIPASGE